MSFVCGSFGGSPQIQNFDWRCWLNSVIKQKHIPSRIWHLWPKEKHNLCKQFQIYCLVESWGHELSKTCLMAFRHEYIFPDPGQRMLALRWQGRSGCFKEPSGFTDNTYIYWDTDYVMTLSTDCVTLSFSVTNNYWTEKCARKCSLYNLYANPACAWSDSGKSRKSLVTISTCRPRYESRSSRNETWVIHKQLLYRSNWILETRKFLPSGFNYTFMVRRSGFIMPFYWDSKLRCRVNGMISFWKIF